MRTKKYYKLRKKNIYSGSGRDRTYSALRQQIVIGEVYDTPILPIYFQSAIYDSLLCYYSLSRLSNCGADPIAPNTLFYNHNRESNLVTSLGLEPRTLTLRTDSKTRTCDFINQT